MATSDGTSPPVTFSFSDFLEKMKDPAAADLVRSIKGFIHHFEQRASTYRPNHEADSAAVQDFLRRMEFAFRAHQAWKGATPEVIEPAKEVRKLIKANVLYPTVNSLTFDFFVEKLRFASFLAAFITPQFNK